MSDADRMEQRLREWAGWLTAGGCGDGYAAVNVLHPGWSPPTPGALPSLKVGRSDRRERLMHAAVLQLSTTLQTTLVVHYCKRLAVVDQAMLLQCAESTVHQRVRDAKVRLASALAV
jgi:DNA-directed RNA polymerase specialized sigma24 family protein